MMYYKIFISFLVLFSLIIMNHSLLANQPDRPPEDKIKETTIKFASSKDPVSFIANKIQYNNNLGLIIATGKVIIKQNQETLKADKVYIQKDQSIIIAEGNVVFINNQGQRVFANKATAINSFNNILIDDAALLFTDDTIMTAKNIINTKIDKYNYSKNYNACYTACRIGNFITPFWSLSAARIDYNEKDDTVTAYSAVFKIKTVPILWLPFFRYSSPLETRKYGFLTPEYGVSSTLDNYVVIPLFIPVNQHANLLLKLYSSTTVDNMYTEDYTSYIPGGELDISSSFSQNQRVDQILNNNNNRYSDYWHANIFWQQDLSDQLRITGNYSDASSISYLYLYPLPHDGIFLKQNIVLEDFINNNNYLSAALNGDSSYYTTISRLENPYVLPEINYIYFSTPNKLDSIISNTQYVNIVNNKLRTRDFNQDNSLTFRLQKIINTTSAQNMLNTPIGVLESELLLQSSLYYFDDYKFPINITKITNRTVQKLHYNYTSISGGSSIKYSYPLSIVTNDYINTLSPIGQITASNNFTNTPLNYLGSANFEVNALNLFEINKYDNESFASNVSANYGVLWSLVNRNGFNGEMLLGQSFIIKNLENSQNRSLYPDRSNVVAYLEATPNNIFHIDFQSILNTNSRRFKQVNLNITLGSQPIIVGTGYYLLRDLDPTKFNPTSYSTIDPFLQLKISNNFSASSSASFDLKNNFVTDFKGVRHLKSIGTYLSWHNNCISINIGANRSYQNIVQIKPQNTFSFSINFKTLGSFAINSVSNTEIPNNQVFF